MSFDQLISDIDRIKKRQKFSKKCITEKIDQVINVLQATQTTVSKLDSLDPKYESLNLKSEFQKLHHELSNIKPLQSIQTQHKEYFAFISKLGKKIEKMFNVDINEVINDDSMDIEYDEINSVIAEHLIREGKFDLEQIFNEEAGLKTTSVFRETFQQLYDILQAIKRKDLAPVIKWVEENNEKFREMESKLLFVMHKLQFTNILKNEGRQKAILYAQKYFPQFSKNNLEEIQKLMTSILFSNSIDNSPYSEFYNENNWKFIENLIISETCKLLEKSSSCPLLTTVTAGTLALPKFLKFSSVATNTSSWKDKNEIPIEIEIGKDFKFHSILVCPVSKEITTPENPAMLLKCGHVISNHSLKKMSGNTNRSKFKCPTCPTEMTMQQTREIHF